MEEYKKIILNDMLNGLTRKALYRFSKDIIDIDIESNILKEDLVAELIREASEDQGQCDKLINYINIAQEWGRQHIYLYRSSSDTRQEFRRKTADDISEILNDAEVEIELNEEIPLFVPEDVGYEIYKVQHVLNRRILISWAEKRIIYSRDQDNDYHDEDANIEYRAWKTHVARGILSLDWDLATGQMMIKVSQSSRKTEYKEGEAFVLNFMEQVFGINDWTPIDIRKSIAQIKDSNEVSTKKFNQETTAGGSQSLSARDKTHGIEADSELNQASRAIRGRYSSTYGNFFWHFDDDENILKEVHTTIDSKTNSFLIYSIQPELTVRYIIGRIIHFIR